MIKIQLSPKAIDDLQQTKEYIVEEFCSEQAAINTVAKITKRIGMLADFPEIGAPLSSVIGIETDYRFLVCGNYTVFYRLENDIVRIVRILYGRRDFVQILLGESQDN
jgi:plasmid stabilization system protein ParE